MAIIQVQVEVQKEPTNEMEDWTPPSTLAVAAFILSRASHVETDDGWFISAVVPVSPEPALPKAS